MMYCFKKSYVSHILAYVHMNPPSTRSIKKRHSLKKKRQRHRSRKQHIHTTPTLSKNVPVIKTSVIASCPKHNDLEDRIRAALWGLFIGDALAMPVHWYYSLHQLKQDFGRIDRYYSPKAHFPGSIMALSNTGGAGRGSNDGDIIGSVILHGKKKYWARDTNYHYHHGLLPGENTLDANIVQLTMKQLIKDKGKFSALSMRKRYVKFMTTPGTHNDTYASTTHRLFFEHFAKGLPLSQCPGNDNHNVDTIDALPLLVPYILAHVARYGRAFSSNMLQRLVRNVMSLFRKDTNGELQKYGMHFGHLLVHVLNDEMPNRDTTQLRKLLKDAAAEIQFDVATSVAQDDDPMTACYLSSSYPALIHFAYKYADSFEEALLANANAGGENVARGACLGALVGAYRGKQAIPKWMLDGLYQRKRLHTDVNGFVRSTLHNV